MTTDALTDISEDTPKDASTDVPTNDPTDASAHTTDIPT